MIKKNKILLGHGSGGKLSHELIHEMFRKHFSNSFLDMQTDSAVLSMEAGLVSFTTDSFVVDPIFFPGGDIGKLAVCGTVNDLSVSGAIPMYISAGFIIEEGFALEDLERIVKSMAAEAAIAGVIIVTGDTKVVNKGKCDKVFINTAGIGKLAERNRNLGTGLEIRPGDKILVNGTIGDHGMAVMAARKELGIQGEICSDCASLNNLIEGVLSISDGVKFMRDPTRGGLATVVAELASDKPYGIMIDESQLPVNPKVRAFCEILGFDPLYVANEGKVILVVEGSHADQILDYMRRHALGRDSRIIGEICNDYPGKAWMKTAVGGKRILDMLAGEQLPRIC